MSVTKVMSWENNLFDDFLRGYEKELNYVC